MAIRASSEGETQSEVNEIRLVPTEQACVALLGVAIQAIGIVKLLNRTITYRSQKTEGEVIRLNEVLAMGSRKGLKRCARSQGNFSRSRTYVGPGISEGKNYSTDKEREVCKVGAYC